PSDLFWRALPPCWPARRTTRMRRPGLGTNGWARGPMALPAMRVRRHREVLTRQAPGGEGHERDCEAAGRRGPARRGTGAHAAGTGHGSTAHAHPRGPDRVDAGDGVARALDPQHPALEVPARPACDRVVRGLPAQAPAGPRRPGNADELRRGTVRP